MGFPLTLFANSCDPRCHRCVQCLPTDCHHRQRAPEFGDAVGLRPVVVQGTSIRYKQSAPEPLFVTHRQIIRQLVGAVTTSHVRRNNQKATWHALVVRLFSLVCWTYPAICIQSLSSSQVKAYGIRAKCTTSSGLAGQHTQSKLSWSCPDAANSDSKSGGEVGAGRGEAARRLQAPGPSNSGDDHTGSSAQRLRVYHTNTRQRKNAQQEHSTSCQPTRLRPRRTLRFVAERSTQAQTPTRHISIGEKLPQSYIRMHFTGVLCALGWLLQNFMTHSVGGTTTGGKRAWQDATLQPSQALY